MFSYTDPKVGSSSGMYSSKPVKESVTSQVAALEHENRNLKETVAKTQEALARTKNQVVQVRLVMRNGLSRLLLIPASDLFNPIRIPFAQAYCAFDYSRFSSSALRMDVLEFRYIEGQEIPHDGIPVFKQVS